MLHEEVKQQLHAVGVISGDGITALRELRRTYMKVGRERLSVMWHKFGNLKQDGEYIQYLYKFKKIVQFWENVEIPLHPVHISLQFQEGLIGPQFTSLKQQLDAISVDEMPSFEEVDRRARHADMMAKARAEGKTESQPATGYAYNATTLPALTNAENKATIPSLTSITAEEIAHLTNRRRLRENGPPRKDKVMMCTNCHKRHEGGEWECKQPCRRCKSTTHTQFKCAQHPRNKQAHAAELQDFSINMDINDYLRIRAARGGTPILPRQNTYSRTSLLDSGASEHYIDVSDAKHITPVPPGQSPKPRGTRNKRLGRIIIAEKTIWR
jgi:hypothetical protein